MTQPLARLAFYLLEPASDDGLVAWNFLDDQLKDARPIRSSGEVVLRHTLATLAYRAGKCCATRRTSLARSGRSREPQRRRDPGAHGRSHGVGRSIAEGQRPGRTRSRSVGRGRRTVSSIAWRASTNASRGTASAPRRPSIALSGADCRCPDARRAAGDDATHGRRPDSRRELFQGRYLGRPDRLAISRPRGGSSA